MWNNLVGGCAPDAPLNEEGLRCWRIGSVFVTGPTDAANKLSEFYCRVCRKDVSVRTHGEYEDHPALPRTPPFLSRSATSARDTRLAGAGL